MECHSLLLRGLPVFVNILAFVAVRRQAICGHLLFSAADAVFKVDEITSGNSRFALVWRHTGKEGFSEPSLLQVIDRQQPGRSDTGRGKFIRVKRIPVTIDAAYLDKRSQLFVLGIIVHKHFVTVENICAWVTGEIGIEQEARRRFQPADHGDQGLRICEINGGYCIWVHTNGFSMVYFLGLVDSLAALMASASLEV